MIVDTKVIHSTSHPTLTGTLPLNAFTSSAAQQQQQQPQQSALLSLNGVAERTSLNALSSPPSEQSFSRSSPANCPSHSGEADDDDDDDDDGAANITSASSLWVEVPEQGVISMELSGWSQGKCAEEEEAEERSCCYDADDIMDDQRAEHKIVDIPYSVLLSIYQSLDADKGWEKLAAETGYTFDKIRLLELEGSRYQGSPSRSLLWELGSRNITIRQLYGYLNTLSRYREMNILEDYVHNPSKPSFENNGLRGLPDARHNTSSSLKGLKSPSSKKTNSSSGNNSSSINFNQQVVNSDVNISMKCQQTDKYYPGKQMPFLSPPSATSNSAANGNEAPKNPSSIMAPTMKPANPGSQVMTGGSNVKLVQNMIKQMPGGASGSRLLSSTSSSAQAQSQYQTTTSASTPSSSSTPHSDSTFPSGVSSLAGLESSFDVHMALIGSACFSYSEVVQATNCFSEQNKLGEGAFGTVYFGVLRKNKCAVKKMAEADGQDAVVERSTQRELTSLLKFRHENIVTLYGYAVDGASLCLIYQFMPNGSLEDRLMCKGNTPPVVWSQRLNIMLGACQGLNFLHTMGEQPLIHGDIKSANILLDKHMEAKIGDLGQAQQANGREGGSTTSRLTHITRAEATTKVYGTRAYQPQEVQTGSRPSTKSDVFAMGVVLLEIFSGEKAFDERREGEKFLAEDFRSLKGESGDDACLNKLDRRGGECPREVCLKILNIADVCTSHLKRHRPDSIQLLQKVTELDELYTQKTGIKHAGTDSLPGSEHSCHLSHCSSPAASVPNLSGAPPRNDHPRPPHGAAAASTSDVNVNRDQPSEKHFAMHLHHEKPDNCCMVNKNLGQSPSPQSSVSRQHSQSPPSSSCRSPIDYFQNGQALPPAFRLQQAYDSQSERERKRISCLPQYPSTKQRDQHAESTDTLVLPQSDPAKLAALEQFDRENLHGLVEEKESNSFQSDPKKLAALKQFDEQGYHVHEQEGHIHSQEQVSLLENNLASDPAKLAQLRLFDDSNMKTLDDRPSQRMERGLVDSDPRKLAALTQFDAVNSSPHALSAMSSVTDSDPQKLAALTQFDAANCVEPLAHIPGQPANMKSVQTGAERNRCAQEPFPVSELDYVVSSQREALEACTSLGHQPQQAIPPETFSLSGSHRSDSAVATASVTDTCPAELRVTSATGKMNVPAQITAPSSLLSGETLLRRQQNFFDMYNRALEEIDDEEDFGDENAEFENGNVQESENQRYTGNAVQASNGGEVCSPAAQDPGVATRIDGHCHPIPTEQDESVLNYFKQRQQHYEKTFNKPQVSPC